MNFTEIRHHVIIALFSDELLMSQLVLKGGSALGLIHELSQRASIDLDFSIGEDFDELEETKERVFRALEAQFSNSDYMLFDFEMVPRPSHSLESKWGGYLATFKLIPVETANQVGNKLESMRRQAISTNERAHGGRKFKIEISKHEYCEGWEEVELQQSAVRVYTPTMIAIEKLRALCQQLKDYPHRTNSTPRARDFYDIHAILSSDSGISLESDESRRLIRAIFTAKDVSPTLLSQLSTTREFHRQDWASVEQALTSLPEAFDYYFDYVIRRIPKLESLRDI